MKLATWNVNSLNVRLPHVVDWLATANPDLIGLQEIKLVNDKFPYEALLQAGYQALVHGQKTYNGVAILSRLPITPAEVVTVLPGMSEDPQCRLLAASYQDIRFINVYVPNGAEVGSDKFHYKLRWLEALTEYIRDEIARYPKLALVGDFNIAPEDRDVHDPNSWQGSVLVSAEERAYFQRLIQLGLCDSFRLFDQPEATYSWWDYRAAAFVRNHGLRIDHILLSPDLAVQCRSCVVDVTPRRRERPSDHAPVAADLT